MDKRNRTSIIAAFCMLLIILDTKTALSGAQEGINLCIMTVIPALLPFFFLSILLTSNLTGSRWSLPHSVGRLVRVPSGSETIFLIGALGGYPTGAQAVSQAYEDGYLKQKDAKRMLGFCCNAGPSFLFGITGAFFSDRKIPWILWFIHLISAILTGMILPGGGHETVQLKSKEPLSIPDILKKSLSVMTNVCGWIILFRVTMAFLNRWILWFAGPEIQIFINGLLELTNGCTALKYIQNEGVRFIFSSVLVAFGGLCVAMQTRSVTGSLGFGMYFPGKLLQSMISFLMSALYQQATFGNHSAVNVHPVIYISVTAIMLITILLLQKKKNSCSFSVSNVV